ncbi:type II secretion system protein GspK [Bradyrhizobium manausense]|uniref:type II secretion system protein GspK n=1 Tax=Bradyrhizobium manausense TaxID=989370 RepID=UPI001BA9E0B6|nr:type II secretion system protein GspK [Bradyrhizobium manausense]MBR0725022.1 general secretion pathway protein GspK [Bradyrhizobium manausense]
MSVAPARHRMRHHRGVPNRPPPGLRKRHGFALITVIWGLGLLTLLGAAVIVGARYRARAASADGSVLSSAAAAESAVNFTIASILSPTPNASFPKKCRMPGGEQAEIVVEEEVGKIDINAASLTTLERFFAAAAQDKALGSRIAQNIVAFRKPLPRRETANQTASSGNQTAPTNAANEVKSSGFSTILELDQVDGMSPALLRSALRYTTTLSGRVEPAPEAMTPALRLLMGLDQGRPEPRRPTLPGHFTIRADVRASDGSRFIREALVSFGASSAQPYTIREWRRGDIMGGSASPLPAGEPAQACIKL